MIDPVIKSVLLILFGYMLSFVPYFIRQNYEEKRHRDSLLHGIVANVNFHRRAILSIGEQRLKMDRGFFQYLLNSGDIRKISPILVKLIDYDNALRFFNNLLNRSTEDHEWEIKVIDKGTSLINDLKSNYPKIKFEDELNENMVHNPSGQP